LKKSKNNTLKNTKTSSKKTKLRALPAPPKLSKEQAVHEQGEAQQPSSPLKSSKALVYMIGESPLVEHYAELCADHGYDVCVSWNNPLVQKPEFKSSSIKISHTIPAHTSLAIELTNIDFSAKRKNLEKLAKELPETAPILSSSITVTATEQSAWIAGKHRLVGIAAFPTIIEKPIVEVAPTIYSPKETLEVISRFFRTSGKDIEIVQDRIGMVLPRILCQVINEAAFAIMEDIAAPQDIDKALTLGMHFPHGPIAWAERIGLDQVYAVLAALHADLQEERYRIAPLLKQMASTGVWWKQTQTN
jgi:3-hydroxybutyryl-CoA dehydrogenase